MGRGVLRGRRVVGAHPDLHLWCLHRAKERSDRCTIGRTNALGSPIMPSPLDAVTTDESGANADSATDTDTELAVVDVTRSGSPQVPSAVACTSLNVETNVEEDARSDTANLVTGSST